MRAIKYISAVMLLTLALGGCKRSEIPTYNTEYDAVRFPYRAQEKGNVEPEGYSEDRGAFMVSYSFFGDEESPGHTVSVPIYLIGKESDRDRQIVIEEVSEESTAPAGSFAIVKAVIPARDSVGHLEVEVKNIPLLKEQNVEAVLRIVDSPDLMAGPDEHTKLILTWGIKLPTPVADTYVETYNLLIDAGQSAYDRTLDYFSPKALEVIVLALGWTDWDDEEKHGSDYNKDGYKYLPSANYTSRKQSALARVIDDYIKSYNTAHPDAPLLHDDGAAKGQPIRARVQS